MFADIKRIEAEWKARMHKALSFDGEDDYVEIPYSSSYDNNQSFFVTAWFKLNDWSNWGEGYYGTLFDWHDTFTIGLYDWGIELYVRDADGNTRATGNMGVPLETGKWYFVVFGFDGQKLVGYVNGAKTGEFDDGKGFSTLTNPIYIGANPLINQYSNIVIDEVRIYNRALSDAEIKYLYHNPFDPIDSEHLVLWLNPAGIDIANGKWWDLSGKGNHGTIHGATEVVNLVEEEVIIQ